MSEESARLRIPYLAASQAQKHVTHNEALTLLDTLVQASVIDKDLTTPPISPVEGDCYIVAVTGTGAWTGWDNRIVRYIDGEWRSYLPGAGSGEGWLVYVRDEEAIYVFTGSAWEPHQPRASTTEVLAGTDASKVVTPDALAALWEKGSNVASAATVSLGEGGFFHITGTTTITDIDFATAKNGRFAWVVFDGALTLTHNGTTLVLPGGANITTAAGDRALFVQDASDNVYCLAYIRASGLPLPIDTDGTLAANSDAKLATQKATKTYADARADLRAPFMYCRIMATGNVDIATALNNGDTLNGVSLLNGDPVFLAFQTNPAENGVWIVFSTPFRSPAFPTYMHYAGALISLVQGTLYAGSVWQCTNTIGGVLDVSALNFALRAAGPPPHMLPGGRLTNSSGVPVPTSDVAAAATIYYAPYLHRLVPIYDGVQFVPTDIGGELSQALSDTTKSPAAAANNSNYDLFVWNDAGTIRCTRGPLWSSGTARGTGAGTTELERVKGIWVNKIAITNGPAAQRGTYVGSIRTNGSAQVDFTPTGTPPRLMVWNAYNRRPVFAKRIESTDSWAYATASFQQANASANNQIEALYGQSEDAVDVTANHYVGNGGSGAGENMGTGVGLDSTSVDSAVINQMCTLTNANWAIALSAKYAGVPGLGYHYFAWLERGSTHATFYGDNFFGLPVKSGIAYRGEH